MANIIPSLPYNIQAGQPVSAAPVMSNFNTIESDVNANAAPLNSPSFTGTVSMATPLGISSGGTGQTTQQAAINILSGAVTGAQYLRGNGTNVVMSAIQVADVPTLNQNTTGTSSNVTGVVAVVNGGTGVTSATGSGSVVLSASPALTGAPRAPTPAAGDASTLLATTAFVSGAFRSINVQTFTASGTYTPSANMRFCIIEAVGGALNLPGFLPLFRYVRSS
jgi:hypothetical protein